MCGHFGVVCAWSGKTVQELPGCTAVVDFKSVGEWSEAAIHPSKIANNCCGGSVLLLTKPIRLSKLDAVPTFVMFEALRLSTTVHSGFQCPDSSNP